MIDVMPLSSTVPAFGPHSEYLTRDGVAELPACASVDQKQLSVSPSEPAPRLAQDPTPSPANVGDRAAPGRLLHH